MTLALPPLKEMMADNVGRYFLATNIKIAYVSIQSVQHCLKTYGNAA